MFLLLVYRVEWQARLEVRGDDLAVFYRAASAGRRYERHHVCAPEGRWQ